VRFPVLQKADNERFPNRLRDPKCILSGLNGKRLAEPEFEVKRR